MVWEYVNVVEGMRRNTKTGNAILIEILYDTPLEQLSIQEDISMKQQQQQQ